MSLEFIDISFIIENGQYIINIYDKIKNRGVSI